MKVRGLKITSVLKDAGLTESVSEGKRLILQGGLKVDGCKKSDPDFILNIPIGSSLLIKAGKRRFLKIIQI
ncbi:MAG: hypothetical protein JEY91_10010 [Spirochaetaceae bacterium]|nr:hypothetical protein [Spirochaetaceae bacterium]